MLNEATRYRTMLPQETMVGASLQARRINRDFARQGRSNLERGMRRVVVTGCSKSQNGHCFACRGMVLSSKSFTLLEVTCEGTTSTVVVAAFVLLANGPGKTMAPVEQNRAQSATSCLSIGAQDDLKHPWRETEGAQKHSHNLASPPQHEEVIVQYLVPTVPYEDGTVRSRRYSTCTDNDQKKKNQNTFVWNQYGTVLLVRVQSTKVPSSKNARAVTTALRSVRHE